MTNEILDLMKDRSKNMTLKYRQIDRIFKLQDNSSERSFYGGKV